MVADLVLKRVPSALSRDTSASATESAQPIGVLPFLDITEAMDQEYFADGVTKERNDMRSKMPGLRVPARTSSLYFKGKQIALAEIAKTLGIACVLESSLRKSGKTLRVTAPLIRAKNGCHVWSNTYDRSLDNVLMVQDDIAMEVKKALLAALQSAAHAALGGSAEQCRLSCYFFRRARCVTATVARRKRSRSSITCIRRRASIPCLRRCERSWRAHWFINPPINLSLPTVLRRRHTKRQVARCCSTQRTRMHNLHSASIPSSRCMRCWPK